MKLKVFILSSLLFSLPLLSSEIIDIKDIKTNFYLGNARSIQTTSGMVLTKENISVVAIAKVNSTSLSDVIAIKTTDGEIISIDNFLDIEVTSKVHDSIMAGAVVAKGGSDTSGG